MLNVLQSLFFLQALLKKYYYVDFTFSRFHIPLSSKINCCQFLLGVKSLNYSPCVAKSFLGFIDRKQCFYPKFLKNIGLKHY